MISICLYFILFYFKNTIFGYCSDKFQVVAQKGVFSKITSYWI